MSERDLKRAFAARPSDAEAWVRSPESPPSRDAEPSLYTARLTIDITPGQRERIKVAAFQRGMTVADVAHARCSRANSPNMMEVRNDGKLTRSPPNREHNK
jgi:hypothetical protein